MKCQGGRGVSVPNDYEILGLNPTEGGIHLMTVWCFIAQSFFITLPSSRYDLNNVERGMKQQNIIVINPFIEQYFVCWKYYPEC